MAKAQAGKAWRQESLAGLSSVLALLPGLLVVPLLLAQAGMSFSGAYFACLLTAALGTLLLSLWGKSVLSAVPDAGLAAWLVYGEIISHGHSWQLMLGFCFLSSLLGFWLRWFCRNGRWACTVPEPLGRALPGALGLLLILQGLEQSRMVVASSFSVTMLGNFSDPSPYLALSGILVTMAFILRGYRMALLGGMACVAVIALIEGFWALPSAPFAWPEGLGEVAGKIDFSGWEKAWGILPALLVVQLIQPWATFQGLEGKKDSPGLARKQMLLLGTSAVGSCLGSLPLNVPVESAAGAVSGGQTGRTAAVQAIGFLLLAFCEPLVSSLVDFPAVSAPILVGAGFLLLLRCGEGWQADDLAGRMTAVCLLVVLPLSHSVVDALGIAWLVYVAGKYFLGIGRQVSLLQRGMAVLFLMYFMLYGV